MRIFHTKYASMPLKTFLGFANQNIDSLTEVGREMLYRLEEIHEELESGALVCEDGSTKTY